MFDINYIEDKNDTSGFVILMNPKTGLHAKIALSQGGSLQELSINKTTLIKELDNQDYKESYASSILFPFVNRIENGAYSFNGDDYRLDKNSKGEENAIHGLVYDKSFEIIHQEITDDYALISLFYQEKDKPQGFPFNYSITLTYILTDTSLELKVKVENTDLKSFPFSIGWHPYFISSDLYNSFLEFESDKKFNVNENKIPTDTENVVIDSPFQIKGELFDDCFKLIKNKISLKTPDYKVNIYSSVEENYVQLYTPIHRNAIAIEPTITPANSFNNKINLQVLDPNKKYKISWKIELESNEKQTA